MADSENPRPNDYVQSVAFLFFCFSVHVWGMMDDGDGKSMKMIAI